MRRLIHPLPALLLVFTPPLCAQEEAPRPAATRALAFTLQPENTTVAAGQSATFRAEAASDGAPVRYQWSFRQAGLTKYTKVEGATQATFTTAPTTLAQNGSHLLVKATAGGVTIESRHVRLGVAELPVITVQPKSKKIGLGESVSFSVQATASGATPTYQWYQRPKAGRYAPIPGATQASYWPTGNTGASLSDDGRGFFVRVSANGLTVESKHVALSVSEEAPVITRFESDSAWYSVLKGQPKTLNWEFSGGRGVLSPAAGSPPLASSGSCTVNPSENTAYRLTVTNKAGYSRSREVTVKALQDTFVSAPNGGVSLNPGHSLIPLRNGSLYVLGTREMPILYSFPNTYLPVPIHPSGPTRQHPSGTLLADGRVLITGGSWEGGMVLNTAEIYDPETNTQVSTGSMNTARVRHQTTLLKNGLVLVTGGHSEDAPESQPPGMPITSAELFDPATGRFTPIDAPQNHARNGHTATLLGNGKVLLVGGVFLEGPEQNTVEIFDPETLTFSLVPNSADRNPFGHTATLLPDGRVLLAGGHRRQDWFDYVTRPWIYSPEARPEESIQTFAEEIAPRAYHAATLMENGSVLLSGGDFRNEELRNTTYVRTNPGAPRLVEPGPDLTFGRSGHNALRLKEGFVLIFGGEFLNHFGSMPEAMTPSEPTR